MRVRTTITLADHYAASPAVRYRARSDDVNRPNRFICVGPGTDCSAPEPSWVSNEAAEKKTSGGRQFLAGGATPDCGARPAVLPVLASCRGGDGAKRGCWRRVWLVIASCSGGGGADAGSLVPRHASLASCMDKGSGSATLARWLA